MSEDTTLFRLNQIDSRLTGIDEKFNTIVDKIDSLKEDLIKSKCSQPNMCLILKTIFPKAFLVPIGFEYFPAIGLL